MGASDNKTLSASCAGCGKEYPTQRHPNLPQITGFPVRVNGAMRSVPLCRACVEKGIRADDVAEQPMKATG